MSADNYTLTRDEAKGLIIDVGLTGKLNPIVMRFSQKGFVIYTEGNPFAKEEIGQSVCGICAKIDVIAKYPLSHAKKITVEDIELLINNSYQLATQKRKDQ